MLDFRISIFSGIEMTHKLSKRSWTLCMELEVVKNLFFVISLNNQLYAYLIRSWVQSATRLPKYQITVSQFYSFTEQIKQPSHRRRRKKKKNLFESWFLIYIQAFLFVPFFFLSSPSPSLFSGSLSHSFVIW